LKRYGGILSKRGVKQSLGRKNTSKGEMGKNEGTLQTRGGKGKKSIRNGAKCLEKRERKEKQFRREQAFAPRKKKCP